MYVPKSEFGWNRRTGWLHGDEASYNNAVELMKTVQPGRARTRPIHESWNDYLEYFDPRNPERSQGAFCRSVKMSRSALSNALSKPLTGEWNMALDCWIEELQKAESE